VTWAFESSDRGCPRCGARNGYRRTTPPKLVGQAVPTRNSRALRTHPLGLTAGFIQGVLDGVHVTTGRWTQDPCTHADLFDALESFALSSIATQAVKQRLLLPLFDGDEARRRSERMTREVSQSHAHVTGAPGLATGADRAGDRSPSETSVFGARR
jgi:hypothetical protein